jgi:hypothetical protein
MFMLQALINNTKYKSYHYLPIVHCDSATLIKLIATENSILYHGSLIVDSSKGIVDAIVNFRSDHAEGHNLTITVIIHEVPASALNLGPVIIFCIRS